MGEVTGSSEGRRMRRSLLEAWGCAVRPGGGIPGRGSFPAAVWGQGKNRVLPRVIEWGVGVCWLGASLEMGGWRSRWEPEDKGFRGLGDKIIFSPVGAGEKKILKPGQQKGQICVFISSSKEVGTGDSTLMSLAGKAVIKGQNERYGP